MSLSLVVGVGIVVACLLFLAFKLDKEHEFLKSMLIIFSFALLIIIPASTNATCENLLVNESSYNVYGNNFTYANGSPNYHWDYDGSTIPTKTVDSEVYLFHIEKSYVYEEVCSNNGIAFVKAYKWVYVVFIAYLIVYLFIKSSFFLAMTNNKRRVRK